MATTTTYKVFAKLPEDVTETEVFSGSSEAERNAWLKYKARYFQGHGFRIHWIKPPSAGFEIFNPVSKKVEATYRADIVAATA